MIRRGVLFYWIYNYTPHAMLCCAVLRCAVAWLSSGPCCALPGPCAPPPSTRCLSGTLAQAVGRQRGGSVAGGDQAAQNARLPRACHFCACRARRGNSHVLRKWHVWCLLGRRQQRAQRAPGTPRGATPSGHARCSGHPRRAARRAG